MNSRGLGASAVSLILFTLALAGCGGGGGSGGSGEHVPLPSDVDPHAGNHSEQARALREQEKVNTQAALDDAMKQLDDAQQTKARALLTEHGYGPKGPPPELPATGATSPNAGSDALPPGEP